MTFDTQVSANIDFSCFYSNFSDITKKPLRFSARSQNNVFKKLEAIMLKMNHLRVSDIIKQDINRGSFPKHDEADIIPVIKTAHVTSNGIKQQFTEFVNNRFYQSRELSQIYKEDILMACSGKPSFGKIDLIKDDIQAIADGHIATIKTNEKLYNRNFFAYFFQSILGCYQIERDFSGCANQIELSTENIMEFLIPDIPLSEQEQIVKEVKDRILKQQGSDSKIYKKIKELESLLLPVVS